MYFIVFRFFVRPSTGQSHDDVLFSDLPSGWFHILLNFVGPNQGAINGFKVAQADYLGNGGTSVTDDSIRIGKYYISETASAQYGSLDIDELVIFDRSLTQDEITTLAGKL